MQTPQADAAKELVVTRSFTRLTRYREQDMFARNILKLAFKAVSGLICFSAAAWAQTTHIVTVGDNFFSPSNLVIQVGDTVEWRNAAGGMPHDVTANDGSFASVTASSFTFSQTFNSAGQVNYRCTVHPATMTGSITVQAYDPPPPPPEPAAELSLKEVSVAPGDYSQGSMISIDAEVENIGDASSGAFSIKHYASENNAISAGDTLLGTENRASLAAGEDSHGPFNVMIPQDLPPGMYYIGSILDFNDANSANDDNLEETPINVVAANNFVINAGLNDAWKNADTGGQGFFINAFPGLQKMFLGWFTFDLMLPDVDDAVLGGAGQRWLTAFGDISGDTATLAVELVRGGIFDSGEPVPSSVPDGTITIKFLDCQNAELTYDITSANVSGQMMIKRISKDNVPLCEALL